MHWAAYHNAPQVIEVLIKYGADINAITKTNPSQNTPLTWAIRMKAYESAKILIEKGADVNIFYDHGINRTALTQSIINKSTEMNEILLKNGADIGEKDWLFSPLSSDKKIQKLLELYSIKQGK